MSWFGCSRFAGTSASNSVELTNVVWTSTLSRRTIDVTEKFIRELSASGTTIVLATHLIDQGKTLTDTRLHLEEGRSLEQAA